MPSVTSFRNDPDPNPFIQKPQLNGTYSGNHSDIWLNQQYLNPLFNSSVLYLHCGKNNMAEFSINHVYSNGLHPQVDGDNNDYNNPNTSHLIRFNPDIVVTGTTIDLSSPPIQSCGITQTETDCTPIPMFPCDYFVPNPGNWPDISDSAAIENLFWEALEDFCDGVFNCNCVEKRLFDAMQAATLGVNNEEKLALLSVCIKEKLEDSTVMNCIPTYLLLMAAEAQERLGLPDSARITYYWILNNYPNSPDTTLARWRILHIDAFLTDTSYGEVYDSLMKIASNRVLKDIGKIDTSSGGGGQRISTFFKDKKNEDIELPIAELEQNSPNPFTNGTMIKFRLNQEADVRLGIHDNLGQTIKVIINQRLKKGNYQYTYINEGLGSGVYLYLLTTDGKQFTKKMQLTK